MFRQKTMGFVVKITSFLYRYLNGRDEKIFVKKPHTRGARIIKPINAIIKVISTVVPL